jgi:hypothetical protein
MQLRHRVNKLQCSSSSFNTHALSEIVVLFDEGDADSDYISNYDVLLTTGPRAGQWVSLSDAFKQHDVIPNNHNTCFAEPQSDEDRERGYSP